MVEAQIEEQPQIGDGFSERLSQVMDHAGYPPMERGRVARLSEDLELAKMTISKWFSNSAAPSGKNFDKLAKVLLRKLGSFASIEAMKRWLAEGDEAFNPIVLYSHRGIDYTLFSQVFQSVHIVAIELGIPLETVPQSRLDWIYATLIRQAAREGGRLPDFTLIKDLLTAPTAS